MDLFKVFKASEAI